MNLSTDIDFILAKWQVNKAIHDNYPEQYSNIIEQQKNIICNLQTKNIDTGLLTYKIADSFIDLFDSYNIEVEEEIVVTFCKLIIDLESNNDETKKILDKYRI